MLASLDKIETDVIVVGGGAAGTRAALTAADQGAQVIIIDKAQVGLSGATNFTIKAEGTWGVQASLDMFYNDSIEDHYREVIQASEGVCDPELVKILVEEGPNRITELIKWGLPFDRDEKGNLIKEIGCFSNKARAIHASAPVTISNFLLKMVKDNENITILNKTTVIDLMTYNNNCLGVIVSDVNNGEIFFIRSKAVIMANGGIGDLFKYNVNPPELCGDGIAIAYRAGAELTNMEFLQIGIGFLSPICKVDFPRHLWLLKPQLLDERGRNLLDYYLPANLNKNKVYKERAEHFPFSSSDDSLYIDLAISQANKTSLENKGVRLKINSSEVDSKYINEFHSFKKTQQLLKAKGLSWNDENLRVGLYFHSINGGIKIKKTGAVYGFNRLFAAGEVADGVHGANRLGGNMLLATQVFGYRSGITAVDYNEYSYGDKIYKKCIENWKEQHTAGNGLSFIRINKIISLLSEECSRELLVSRDDKGLEVLYKHIINWENELKESDWPENHELWLKTKELQNRLQSAKLITVAARERKESRGSHYRIDFPDKDPGFCYKLILTRSNEKNGIQDGIKIIKSRGHKNNVI